MWKKLGYLNLLPGLLDAPVSILESIKKLSDGWAFECSYNTVDEEIWAHVQTLHI